MAWGDKGGMQKRKESKDQDRHTRGAAKKKAIRDDASVPRTPKKKGKKK